MNEGGPQDQNSKSPAQAVATEPAVAKPPQVTYEDGQLTIVAENTPLAEVMKALRAALGAEIELPSAAVNQRIWVRLGPGPARRVLRDLLDGTEFNYLIQASEDDADGIRSVLLTQRNKAAGPGSPAMQERSGKTRISPGSTDEDAADPENLAKAEPAATPEVAPVDPSAPQQDQRRDASNQQSMAGNSSASAPGVGPPATDRMVQQLQSMYEQRRQLQIRQNQKPPAPNQ